MIQVVLPRFGIEARTTPKAVVSRGAEAGDASFPLPPFEMQLSRSRKYCAICMERKTMWLCCTWTLDGQPMRYRLCFMDMAPVQRQRIQRQFYA